MAWIEMIPEENAEGALKEAYDQLIEPSMFWHFCCIPLCIYRMKYTDAYEKNQDDEITFSTMYGH